MSEIQTHLRKCIDCRRYFKCNDPKHIYDQEGLREGIYCPECLQSYCPKCGCIKSIELKLCPDCDPMHLHKCIDCRKYFKCNDPEHIYNQERLGEEIYCPECIQWYCPKCGCIKSIELKLCPDCDRKERDKHIESCASVVFLETWENISSKEPKMTLHSHWCPKCEKAYACNDTAHMYDATLFSDERVCPKCTEPKMNTHVHWCPKCQEWYGCSEEGHHIDPTNKTSDERDCPRCVQGEYVVVDGTTAHGPFPSLKEAKQYANQRIGSCTLKLCRPDTELIDLLEKKGSAAFKEVLTELAQNSPNGKVFKKMLKILES